MTRDSLDPQRSLAKNLHATAHFLSLSNKTWVICLPGKAYCTYVCASFAACLREHARSGLGANRWQGCIHSLRPHLGHAPNLTKFRSVLQHLSTALSATIVGVQRGTERQERSISVQPLLFLLFVQPLWTNKRFTAPTTVTLPRTQLTTYVLAVHPRRIHETVEPLHTNNGSIYKLYNISERPA